MVKNLKYQCKQVASGDCFYDVEWDTAKLISDFILVDGKKTPSVQTEAYLLWDTSALYFLFKCEDKNIWGNYSEHNDPIYDEEVVELFLDPWGEGKKYFEFEISPKGVVFAATIENSLMDPPDIKQDYNIEISELDWDIEVVGEINNPQVEDRDWKAGMRIPFSALGINTPEVGDVWRMNLFRIERNECDEYICWSPTFTDPAAFHHPKYFGEIEFIQK